MKAPKIPKNAGDDHAPSEAHLRRRPERHAAEPGAWESFQQVSFSGLWAYRDLNILLFQGLHKEITLRHPLKGRFFRIQVGFTGLGRVWITCWLGFQSRFAVRSAKAGASILGNIFLVLGYGRSPKGWKANSLNP